MMNRDPKRILMMGMLIGGVTLAAIIALQALHLRPGLAAIAVVLGLTFFYEVY